MLHTIPVFTHLFFFSVGTKLKQRLCRKPPQSPSSGAATNPLGLPMDDRRVLSVSELNSAIRGLLEGRFPFVSVAGEISNLHRPYSGHSYFTLKDSAAQIKAVLFKTQQRYLERPPKDGDHVVCRGRISVYEPRGDLHTDAPFSLSQLAYAWNSEGSTNEWMLTATTSSASEAPMQAALNMYVVPREITRAISN